ncbi:cytochrome P450 [Pyrrhoderma noxium]|uniref:Cytochrome P450 n=1 Tax=Pyrrhoderma noxium TaxID=2282107 RepID=A0A286U6Y3_9AGAM|nr:cytochrome P450 [Pyrrhoderma noxium]
MDANSSALAGSLFTTLPGPLLEMIDNIFKSDNYRTPIWASGSLLALSTIYYYNSKKSINVPAIGPENWFLSYWGAREYFKDDRKMLQEGYKKYKERTFKVPQYDRWLVVVNSPKLVDEIRLAPDHILSITEGTDEQFATKFTFGMPLTGDHRIVPVIRTQLTQNIGNLFDEYFEEITNGCDEFIGYKYDEWVSINSINMVARVVFRAINRIFVGLPFCRNDDFMQVNIEHAFKLAKARHTIERFPIFMRDIVAYLVSDLPPTTRKAYKILGPMIEERLRHVEETDGDWPDKPNDLLQWFIDITKPGERNVMKHIYDILVMNFAAIHTSSNTLSTALLYLAAAPENLGPLREEVESIIDKEGWSKSSMQKMWKVDSFLRETLRCRGVEPLTMFRKVVTDYKMSDGTFLPKGTLLAVNQAAAHRNDVTYDRPDEFRPFRFADLRNSSQGESTRNQMVATSSEFLAFGHGRHACPGRFFAANELKAMLAYIILNYDVKLPEAKQVSDPLEADQGSPILFRRRQT